MCVGGREGRVAWVSLSGPFMCVFGFFCTTCLIHYKSIKEANCNGYSRLCNVTSVDNVRLCSPVRVVRIEMKICAGCYSGKGDTCLL